MEKRSGLYRSRTNKVLGGVAAGIADSLNTDASLMRVIFVLLVIFGGSGLLIYLILWIALPEEDTYYFPGQVPGSTPSGADASDKAAEPVSTSPEMIVKPRRDGALIAGLIFIIIGIFFFVSRFFHHIRFWDFWPVILVVAGVILLVNAISKPKKIQQ